MAEVTETRCHCTTARNSAQSNSGTPQIRTCGTMPVHERLLRTSPQYMSARIASENSAFQFARNMRSGSRTGTTVIPVVVHVIFNTAVQNIADAQVQSQISVLNQDYRKANVDVSSIPSVFQPLCGDARIEFELATKDPSGIATSGITRTHTTKTSFADDDQMKSAATGGHDAWPADRYLNLWVVPRLTSPKRPARLRAVPGRCCSHRWRGDPAQRFRQRRHCRGPFQSRSNRDARDRPLARTFDTSGVMTGAAAVGTTSLPTAELRRPQFRQADVPSRQLQQRAEWRLVHELYGLHRRRLHVHVHKRPDPAHAGVPQHGSKLYRPYEGGSHPLGRRPPLYLRLDRLPDARSERPTRHGWRYRLPYHRHA